MFIYRLAYRHANGQVEGFLGHALTSPDQAFCHAVQQITRKIEDGSPNLGLFDFNNIITDASRVTVAELETIKRDWLTYHCKGSAILPLPRKSTYPHTFGDSHC